jgi:para-nitrobenzyl esterase
MFRSFALTFLFLSLPAAYAQDAVVKTESGLVEGRAGKVMVFKGIPYASPPTGDLRWKPPKPPEHWQGIRKTLEFGPACMQPSTSGGALQSEDCLSLNIWTPATGTSRKLPVMVWIHGGGYLNGSGSQPVCNGETLASHGIVVVTFNYRLGVFGFFAHPALTAESPHRSSGNYGLLDQIAALGWVKRNIAGFGGDPERVTIFGQSAGGNSVFLLLVSPLSDGLFQRAIAQSGGRGAVPIRHRSESWYGMKSMEALDLGFFGTDLAPLRRRSVKELLAMAGPPGLDQFFDHSNDKGSQFRPIVDGWIIPDDPGRLFDTGQLHNVPLIAGANADEGTLFISRRPPQSSSLEAYHDYVKSMYGADAARLLALYPAAGEAEVGPSVSRLLGDFMFHHGTRTVARAMARQNAHTYLYLFSRISGLGRSNRLGASHGAEVPYVFGTFSARSPDPNAYDATDFKLSREMRAAWVRFAAAGNPNGAGLPSWPAYRASTDRYLDFGDTVGVRAGFHAKGLDFLGDLFARLREQRKATR